MLPFKQAYCGGGVINDSIHIFRQRKIWIPFTLPARRLHAQPASSKRFLSVCTGPHSVRSEASGASRRRPTPQGSAASLRDAGFAPPQPRLAAQIIKKAALSDCFLSSQLLNQSENFLLSGLLRSSSESSKALSRSACFLLSPFGTTTRTVAWWSPRPLR